MQNTGINVHGKYLAPETDQCQKILETISIMHQMIANNIAANSEDYQLGEQAEKALVLGSPFKTSTNETQLRIWEFTLDDKIELYWKNSLGKITGNLV